MTTRFNCLLLDSAGTLSYSWYSSQEVAPQESILQESFPQKSIP